MGPANKGEIIEKLQKQILSMQGFRETAAQGVNTGLGALEMAFPNSVFPTGAIHEFLSPAAEHAAATTGFMAGLLGRLVGQTGICLWIGARRTVFAPALKIFGIDPDQVIFIDLIREKDVLWTIEEALKCDAVSVVVGELNGITFTESRRLQLAVEQSKVTGLMHCFNPLKINHTTAVARWKITSLASIMEEGMPGVGYPRWSVELLKIRNGKPGIWELEWSSGQFRNLDKPNPVVEIPFGRTA
ncbi:ImuA family protein [Pedobacter antarcticus]|uniref:Error-prone repair protein ImuA n=2 Tax=Pedobacter antarcticus TaxID=34086 RepID=A0A081PEC0_9SPHI|nr:Error-prone repair protein ImuA [Pedobacter antarcticus]KEQ29043.1 hypothetical protein N180_14120 [Pedobacter antarcticus 4BY]SDL53237.1 protein ImuA [Pedobacter antarcticus]SFE31186.1 protein ImuA [Pedobacter antarcticus]